MLTFNENSESSNNTLEKVNDFSDDEENQNPYNNEDSNSNFGYTSSCDADCNSYDKNNQ